MTAAGLRPVLASDLPACVGVFYAAMNELMARMNQPLPTRNEPGMTALFTQLLATDPERAWLVEGADGVEGFGFAQLRERSWFLSFLFVRPASQSRGVGRTILEACLPHDAAGVPDDGLGGATAWDGVLATCADAIQPISNGLYASYGLVPRVPLFTMLGRPRPGSMPPLPASVERVGFDAIAGGGPDGHRRLVELVGDLDRSILGYVRPTEHRTWRLADRRGSAFLDRASGAVLGYGYAQPSGRLGPVAVVDGDLLPSVTGELMSTLQPAGDWQVFVPGIAAGALVGLLRAGFLFEGTPAMYCASRPGPDLSRYLPASFAVL
jgi:GNAT superfamily N-acetyltransferase